MVAPGNLPSLRISSSPQPSSRRQRAADDETARLDRRDQVDGRSTTLSASASTVSAKPVAVEQQGGDVAELDSRLGKVRDGADQRLQFVVGAGHARHSYSSIPAFLLARVRLALLSGSSGPTGATLRFASAQMLR